MDKEIVSSVRNEDAAKITARQQTADAYDYWEVVLTYQKIQKSEVIKMSVSMTSDDPARTFDEEDADAFWDHLWKVGKIMAF